MRGEEKRGEKLRKGRREHGTTQTREDKIQNRDETRRADERENRRGSEEKDIR